MDIQEFNRKISQNRKQIEEFCRRKMPVLAGNIAKRHIEEDFSKGGFTYLFSILGDFTVKFLYIHCLLNK